MVKIPHINVKMYTNYFNFNSLPDGSDYTGTTQTLTFNQGVTSVPITIPISDDSINEVLERFVARLTSSDEDVVIAPELVTVEITDNDGMGSVLLNCP